MRLWESGWLEVNRHRAPIMKAERPLRLLHLSDLHASKAVSLGYLRRALEVGLELNPDLICLTGISSLGSIGNTTNTVKCFAHSPKPRPPLLA